MTDVIVGLVVVAAGVAMVSAGLVWLFGPVALVACGAALVAAGLLMDWEALCGKPARTPPT